MYLFIRSVLYDRDKFPVNGEGCRVTLFVSGCTNHCKGCFQPETWDFHYGQPYTKDTEEYILNLLQNPHIEGLTILGGEPFEPFNQAELVNLLHIVKQKFPEKNIWCFTGFVYDKDLLKGQRKHTNATDEMLSYIDVLVDGPFILQQRDISLWFRGSKNQRVLDMKQTLQQGSIVLYHE